MTTAATVGQKLWNYCNVLRDAGVQSPVSNECRVDTRLRAFLYLEPDGHVAQSGEHLLCKQGVRGSNPLISTTKFRT